MMFCPQGWSSPNIPIGALFRLKMASRFHGKDPLLYAVKLIIPNMGVH